MKSTLPTLQTDLPLEGDETSLLRQAREFGINLSQLLDEVLTEQARRQLLPDPPGGRSESGDHQPASAPQQRH